MIKMLVIAILLLVLGVGITIYHTKSIPDSVSAMVYALPTAGRHLWTLWIWAVSLPLLPCLIEVLGDWQVVGFLWATCISFCGAMPLMENESHKAHNILGVAAGILSQVCVLILCPWWAAVWLPFGLLVITDKTHDIHSIWYGKTVFLSECACYVSLVGCLLFT